MIAGLRNPLLLLSTLLLMPGVSLAHVGSPDVYYDGYAGPYHLLVTVRPPAVIPGVAQIQVRSAANDIGEIQIRPLRLVGPGANLAPRPDTAVRSSADPQEFSGNLWIMDRGSWQVQLQVNGEKGKAAMGVPVPAVSTISAPMQKALGGLLSVLGIILVAGFIGMVGAATREARLQPAVIPTPSQRRRGWEGMAIAAVVVLVAVVGGGSWWGAEARANARLVYKLPHVESMLAGNTLQLHLENPNESAGFFSVGTEREERPDRLRLDDLVPDHGHLMHLFLIRADRKSFWHLHPTQDAIAEFTDVLPSLPAGHYQIYADIVHKTGFPETEIGEIDLPALQGNSLAGDDSGGPDLAAGDKVSKLSDGYRMIWERDAKPLKTQEPIWFRFRIEDQNGKPASDLENYMGMAGHAVFVRDDGKVFAHVHPAGSVSMAAAELAQGKSGMEMNMASMNHASPSGEVSFPYGFPQAGDYHIYVQIKRAGHVETGAFVAHAQD